MRDLLIIPKAVQRRLIKGYLHSAETGESATDAVLHFFNPYGSGDWYVSEAMPLDSDGEPCPDTPERATDWHMFGFANLGDPVSAELGYTLLSQLREIRLRIGSIALPLERELRWNPRPLADIVQEVKAAEYPKGWQYA